MDWRAGPGVESVRIWSLVSLEGGGRGQFLKGRRSIKLGNAEYRFQHEGERRKV